MEIEKKSNIKLTADERAALLTKAKSYMKSGRHALGIANLIIDDVLNAVAGHLDEEGIVIHKTKLENVNADM